jgi:hypothetical protein
VQTIIEYHSHLRRKFANLFISCLISHTIISVARDAKGRLSNGSLGFVFPPTNEDEHLHLLLLLVLKQEEEEEEEIFQKGLIEYHHISDFKNLKQHNFHTFQTFHS